MYTGNLLEIVNIIEQFLSYTPIFLAAVFANELHNSPVAYL